jgi:tetratricopeptide (TPR) repeat protein
MGVVYRARHPELQREVALKVMLGGEHAGDEAYNRFVREARAAGSLRHANIVAVHDVGVHEGLPYIVMDFVPGKSLAGLLHDEDLPARRAVEIIKGIAEAMAYAHGSGIIHRDLKPGNILIDDESGRPMLTDFGLAREVSGPSGLTQSGATLGTPAYMSPEQARGEVVDARSDVYGLGAVLYEVLTGKPPFEADTPYAILGRVIRDEPARVRSLTSGVSRDVELICETAMAKELERRYQTAGAMASDCQAWLDGEAISASAPSMMYLLQRRAKRHRVPILAGLVSLLLTAILVFFFTIRPRLIEAQEDRTALRAALAAKTAQEQQYRALVAAGRYTEAIDGFRALVGTTHALPETLHDRRRTEEPEFAALAAPYAIDLAVAYYGRGLERLDAGDPLARGDLGNAYQIGRDAEDPVVARGALVALANAQIDDGQWTEAARTAAVARDQFGTGANGVRALYARLMQQDGRLAEAAALWHAVREDPKLGAGAKRQLELLTRLLPLADHPSPGDGFRIFQPAPESPLEAVRLMPGGVLLRKRFTGSGWEALEDVTIGGTFESGAMQMLDLDHDGTTEIVCYSGGRARESDVAVLWRTGETWRPTAVLQMAGRIGGLAGGDLDGDGAPELAWRAGREVRFLTATRERLQLRATWQCICFMEDVDITPEGDLILFFGPYLLAAGWKPTWNLHQDGLFVQAPDGSRVPVAEQLPDGVAARWGYRVARYRHAGEGWMQEVQELPERYIKGHVTRMPAGELIVSARADARLTKILPERRIGVFRVPYGPEGFGTPVPFAQVEVAGTAGWFPFSIGDAVHYATQHPSDRLRLRPQSGAAGEERVVGLPTGYLRTQLDADAAPELVWPPNPKAGRNGMRIAGAGAWTPLPLDEIDFGSEVGAELRAALSAEQQLYDSGLFQELAEVCRERIAAKQGLRWNFELGRALSAQGKWAEAGEAYAQASADPVLAPRALLRRMHALEQLRDWAALAECCEQLRAGPQSGPFERAQADDRLRWVNSALGFPTTLEWSGLADAPQFVSSTVLNARNEEGALRLTSVSRYERGAGALVRYAGGPLKLRIAFALGHLGPGPPLYIGLQRVGEGAAYDSDPLSGLWVHHVGRGANDRPAITWYLHGRNRGGASAAAAAGQEAWATKGGEEAVLHLEYQPGFERVWAEIRSTEGALLLALPTLRLAAPLEHGIYLAGIPGLRNQWDGKWGRFNFASQGVLRGVQLQGATTLAKAELEAATPLTALHLGHGLLLRGQFEQALQLYATVDRMVSPDLAGGPGLTMDAAVGRALALLRLGRPEEARTAMLAAAQADGERLRRILVPPFCTGLAPEEHRFFIAVLGG